MAVDTLATIAALSSGHGREAAAQALELHAYVLHMMEKAHGPMAAPLAPVLYAAAKSHAAVDAAKTALPLATRALAINTVALGQHHADTLRMGITVGELQRKLGSLGEAAATLERTVTGGAAALGKEHPTVAAALCALGEVRLQQGEPSAALELCALARVATDTLLQSQPETTPTPVARETAAATVDALRAQGALLSRCGVCEAAVTAYEQALATAEAAHGPTHPAVASAAMQLAYALQAAARTQHREKEEVEAVESSSPSSTPRNSTTEDSAADRDSAASVGGSTGAARAVALAHRSVAITMKQLGSTVHPKVGEALDDLARVLTAAGRDAEAAAVLARKVGAAAEWAQSPLAHTADCCHNSDRKGGCGHTGRHGAAVLACCHMRQASSSSTLDMLCSDQLLPKLDMSSSPGRLCVREVREGSPHFHASSHLCCV